MQPEADGGETARDEARPERPGALRILARANDTQVMIVHGEERGIGPGESLAIVEFMQSYDQAARVSRRCSELLLRSGFAVDPDGWHGYPVNHCQTLVTAARRQVGAGVPAPAEPDRNGWTRERCAWFGYLVGHGHSAKAIAGDPQIATTVNNVHRQAHRFGLSLRAAAQGAPFSARLSRVVLDHYDAVAARAGLTRDAYIQRLLTDIALDA